ncbi:hypothetical protein H7X65_00390 [Candidatus Parcubacteria bacterium]|nr:hypothetical protein [Candidatus Parcubacteria bacterium]
MDFIKPKTFRELQESETFTPDELIATMKDTVEMGAAIGINTTTELIKKTVFSNEQREALKELCLLGHKRKSPHDQVAADEYLRASRLL